VSASNTSSFFLEYQYLYFSEYLTAALQGLAGLWFRVRGLGFRVHEGPFELKPDFRLIDS
jgi:hypothetical protein